MKSAKVSKVAKENLDSFVTNSEVISEITTEGVVVRTLECSKTGKQIISIDGSGDDVILITS